MKFVHSPAYEVDIGAHVFPTTKYRLVRDRLIADGTAVPDDFLEPVVAPESDLLLVHTPEYLDDLASLRRSRRTVLSELPITADIVRSYVLAAGGTILAARTAFERPERMAVHIGGGFHHAFADHAEGFCYINDIAVAIRVLEREGRVARAMVVDLDLHQGNGTAHIFRDDPDVFTISLHQENNYPVKQRSTLDVGLPDGTGDREYLEALKAVFLPSLDRHQPDLLIYVAGADPYEDDELGELKLTMEGLRLRDEMILNTAAAHRVATAVVFAGGYARRRSDTVAIHAQTCRVAAEAAAAALGG